MAYHDFTEMPVWVLASVIVKEVYVLTEKLPKREDYALCGQLKRAAVSITASMQKLLAGGITRIRSSFIIMQEAAHLRSGATYFAGIQ